MAPTDELNLDQRLRDLGSALASGAAALNFEAVTRRAKARRRRAALATAVLVVGVGTAGGLLLQPGTRAAVPPAHPTSPPSTPTPTTSAPAEVRSAMPGVVSDLVALGGGEVAVLYAGCPARSALCTPRLYVTGAHGRPAPLLGQNGPNAPAVSPGTSLAVSAAGDIALVFARPGGNDQGASPAALTVAAGSAPSAELDAHADAPVTNAQLDGLQQGIPVTTDDGFGLVANGTLRPLLPAPLEPGDGQPRYNVMAARDGVLLVEMPDDTDLLSTDLGLTWTAVPDMPGADLTDAVYRQSDTLVRTGRQGWDEKYAIYPVTRLQVQKGPGQKWTTHPVTTPGSSVPLATVVPVDDGTFAAVNADGALYRSDDGEVFTPDVSAPDGAVRVLGGHRGQAWLQLSNGELWLRSAAGGQWRQLIAPE